MKFPARRKITNLIIMSYLVCIFHSVFFSRCSSGTNVTVRIPVPKATVSASHEALGPGQISEMRQQDKTNVWKIKKIEGGREQVLILKVCC